MANDDFDSFDDEDSGKKKSAEFAKMLDESFGKSQRKLKVGDKVRGEILVIGKEELFVSTGTMNDGSVPRRDVVDESGNVPHKVGDILDLYVTQVRGTEIKLSPNPTSKNLADDIEDAFDQMLAVEGRVAEVCKGGVRVSIHGKMAFCPISQLDLQRTETGEEFIGKKLEFRITQFSEGGRNIVVSRRKLLEEQRELTAGSFLEEHRAGDIVQGRVTRMEPFGAFVEVAAAVEGLLHVSEIAWSRIAHPSEALTVGQEVTVKILKIENIEGRVKVSLSIKQTGEAPDLFGAIAEKFPVGAMVKGKIERKELYGVFVKLGEGATGLLHKSKALEHPEFPYDKLKVGDEITVQVGELRREERRISLQLPRDPSSDDWKKFSETQTSGSLGTLGGAFGNALQAALAAKSGKKKS